MKLKKITIFLWFFLFTFVSFSQKSFDVIIKNDLSIQEYDSILKNNKQYLPAFSHKQKYPGAKNPRLLKYYVLGIFDTSFNPLNDSIFKSVYSSIKEVELPIPLSDCENPVFVNDGRLVDGSLNHWHLESINAYCAWSITTGDTSIIVGVSEMNFDTTHVELSGKFVELINTTSFAAWNKLHGTQVAGTIAAKTDNNQGIASIGYNTRLRGLGREIEYFDEDWQRPGSKNCHTCAIWEAIIAGDRIINQSHNQDIPIEVAEEMAESALLVIAAGNYPDCKYLYDIGNVPGVILVAETKEGDFLADSSARHDRIDICAPGYKIPVLDTNKNDRYSIAWGTSYAAPMVAGTAALMLSVNRDLTPAQLEEIIKATAEPLADGHLYPGLIGAGRLNAYRAVKLAQHPFSETLDLYMQDTPEDFGAEPNNISEYLYVSEDIWVRNQNDGVQIHENPRYIPNQPVYVYVRVRNKSIVPSTGSEKLYLHWSKAGPYWDWPGPWEGDMNTGTALLGNLVDFEYISPVEPGEETIVKFEWYPPNPADYEFITDEPWHFCLMARIESDVDPVQTDTRLGEYIKNNNNVAMKNVDIIEPVSGLTGSVIGFMNTFNENKRFRLHFKVPAEEMGSPITKEAEIIIKLSDALYQAWVNGGFQGEGITDMKNLQLRITKPEAYIDFNLDPGGFHTVYTGFNFLTQQATGKSGFKYILELQSIDEKYGTLGGELFIINKKARNLFKANAGNDKLVSKNEEIQLQALSIAEPAVYNWYNMSDSLLYTGINFSTATNEMQTYKLEVIAEKDGYKDYDEVTISVKEFEIKRISPNPVRTNLTIEYDAQNAISASLSVFNANGIQVRSIPLNTQEDSIVLNVAGYQAGTYSISLVCNGQVRDSKMFVVY